MNGRIFKIVPDGASYTTLYSDVEVECKSCGDIVTKLSYFERTGLAEWICKNMHLSREKIGV